MTRISIDRNRCAGHAMCVALLPMVIAVDDTGKANAVAVAPADEIDNAMLAAESCPTEAILLERAVDT
ncbi:ferredoxin [Nocardia gipuzkoensis]